MWEATILQPLCIWPIRSMNGSKPANLTSSIFLLLGVWAYYCMMAKVQGLAFGTCTLVVDADNPSLWNNQGDQVVPQSREYFLTLYLERLSAEMSDRVVFSGSYMADWMSKEHWLIDDSQKLCFPFFGNNSARNADGAQGANQNLSKPDQGQISAICYFGDFTFRHGLQKFCNVIKRLSADLPPHFSIVFAGTQNSNSAAKGIEFIKKSG